MDELLTAAEMSEADRLAILDESIGQAIWIIPDGDADRHWHKLGGSEAFDRCASVPTASCIS
jgi:hypothetical protein